MTDEQQLRNAKEEAANALERAEQHKTLARRLAAGWRAVREDNGFREMLRGLPPVIGEGK